MGMLTIKVLSIIIVPLMAIYSYTEYSSYMLSNGIDIGKITLNKVSLFILFYVLNKGAIKYEKRSKGTTKSQESLTHQISMALGMCLTYAAVVFSIISYAITDFLEDLLLKTTNILPEMAELNAELIIAGYLFGPLIFICYLVAHFSTPKKDAPSTGKPLKLIFPVIAFVAIFMTFSTTFIRPWDSAYAKATAEYRKSDPYFFTELELASDPLTAQLIAYAHAYPSENQSLARDTIRQLADPDVKSMEGMESRLMLAASLQLQHEARYREKKDRIEKWLNETVYRSKNLITPIINQHEWSKKSLSEKDGGDIDILMKVAGGDFQQAMNDYEAISLSKDTPLDLPLLHILAATAKLNLADTSVLSDSKAALLDKVATSKADDIPPMIDDFLLPNWHYLFDIIPQ